MATTTETQQAAAGPSIITSSVPVRLTTRSSRHAIPEAKYMIPGDWKRFQLSELINKVLDYSQPVPFDFIIKDQLLRTTLGSFISTTGISTETVVEIEYVESVLPPRPLASLPHEDWVSDIDASQPGLFLSSAYDGLVRLFSTSNSTTPLSTFSSEGEGPLQSTCWITSPQDLTSKWIASGGTSRTVKVWKDDKSQSREEEEDSAAAVLSHMLPFHSAPVSSIRCHRNGQHLVSSDWNGLVALWDMNSQSSDQVWSLSTNVDGTSRKKRKKNVAPETTVTQKQPLLVFKDHEGFQVSRAIFSSSSTNGNVEDIFTCSHDHSLKCWNVSTCQLSWSKSSTPESCLLDIDQSSGQSNLLVTASSNRQIYWFDQRELHQTISITMSGHSNVVTSVSCHPTKSLLLASASYDGTCKIWDARSPNTSLFTMTRPKVSGKGSKVTCVAWTSDGTILASGGEDGQVVLDSVSVGI